MPPSTRIYKKQNSFTDIRHHKAWKDIVPPIRSLKDRLSTLSLSDYKKGIVRSACAELLGEEPIKKESNEETSSKDVSSEVDDIFFDNRRKK